MIDVLGTAQVALLDARFKTGLIALSGDPAVSFENSSVMGFVFSFGSTETMLRDWRDKEIDFLRLYAPTLKRSGAKAWNVYSILLTSESVSKECDRQVHWISEDLERTRKIAGTGIKNRGDLTRLLLPILPLQHAAVLGPPDVESRLKSRLEMLWPGKSDAILAEVTEPQDVLQLFRGVR